MIFSKVTFRQPQFDNMINSPRGIVGRDLSRRAAKVEIAAKAKVGVKTGALKASIKVQEHSRTVYGQKIVLGSKLDYALVHHEGSRPHVILPVRAKALAFTIKGRLIVTDKVNHPGTRPNRYLTDVLYLAVD